MAQLPCIGLSWPLTKPPFGSYAIYFHCGVGHPNLGHFIFQPLIFSGYVGLKEDFGW